MPIILNDDAAQASVQGANVAVTNKVNKIDYSPKDYSSILTGNGINQGLLRSTTTVNGMIDIIPNHVKNTMQYEARNAENHAYHVHDDLKSYTVLHQDISLCGYISEHENFTHYRMNGKHTSAVPINLIRDHFITFEKNGTTKTYRSKLFLNKIYVYKAFNNYVLGKYTLVIADEMNPFDYLIKTVDTLYYPNISKDPILDLYKDCAQILIKDGLANGWSVKIDDSLPLGIADRDKPMYDLIMDELAIIETPGVLKKTLTALSAMGFNDLRYANHILDIIKIKFILYQTDVIDVVNARTTEEAKSLKNMNVALSLADVLSSMTSMVNQQIPELVGKKYTTQKLTLTNEQIQAVEATSKITIVAAGAGTGKSSCILHRLQHMEECGCDMKNTYVLSFTKAAASNIKKKFKDCKSCTIADFTHSFVDVILADGSNTKVPIVSNDDLVAFMRIQKSKLEKANVLPKATVDAFDEFIRYCSAIESNQHILLDMLDQNLNPEANNIISILKTVIRKTSLELDPIIFHAQLSVLKPNIEHIVIDESQDSNRLEFLTMLKMAMLNDISIYVVGDCAQTLYEFRDADPRILNNLTKLFNTFDLSINHRSTQIILDVANLISSNMTTHKTMLRSNNMMNITQQLIDDAITINTYDKVTDQKTLIVLDRYLEKHLGHGESIAVIARGSKDVEKLYEHISTTFKGYSIENIQSQRRNDIKILSEIGANLVQFLPKTIGTWQEFENLIINENIRINAGRRSNYGQPATVNKIVQEWLTETKPNGVNMLLCLNNPALRDTAIEELQLSMLDKQTLTNTRLQRIMDAKNSKLKEKKADVVVSTVHGVKGLEYDHVASFINTESDRNYGHSTSDENRRIGYVALTRAKQSECIFCTREKLVKDFLAYRDTKPDANGNIPALMKQQQAQTNDDGTVVITDAKPEIDTDASIDANTDSDE